MSHNNVIYEICNEPNGGTDWRTIKGYAEDIIQTIRTYDDAVILVGTPTWSQEVDKPAADPIKGYDNIMYTLHFYADTHKDGLRDTAKAALQSGLPLWNLSNKAETSSVISSGCNKKSGFSQEELSASGKLRYRLAEILPWIRDGVRISVFQDRCLRLRMQTGME